MGAEGHEFRSREKSKCIRLANVEGEYDQRMKKKQR